MIECLDAFSKPGIVRMAEPSSCAGIDESNLTTFAL